MQPKVGAPGVSPMLETMFAGSAANCGPVNATHFAAPEDADVILRCAMPADGWGMDGGNWDASSGQVTDPARHALSSVRMNSGPVPRGKVIDAGAGVEASAS